MNINITIGQYYPTKSLIHSLDCRTKLLGVLIYVTLLFLVNNFIGYLIAFLFLAFVVVKSNVPIKLMLKGLKSIMFIIIFSLILNIFFTDGDTIIFEYKFIKITLEGILISIKMIVRLVLLIVSSAVLTLTTSPLELTDGIELGLKPLKKIRVPAHEIAMMITISLRFIPTLIEELDKIIKAQKSRGADFETGGIVKRAQNLIPILVPLLLSSFRRADDLATAMEARCYRGDYNRTKMKQMEFSHIDYKGFIFIGVFSVLMIGSIFLYKKSVFN